MIRSNITLNREYTVGKTDERLFGSFIEHIGRAIYGGIYEPEHPEADEAGFRKDVAEAVRALRVPVIRYPGGNFVSGYHWEDGVGPVEKRTVVRELAWQALEPNRVGTDEFCRWCGRVGASPLMAVNLGTRGAEDAKNLVEYCNAPAGSKYADMRCTNGQNEPYGIKTWCLGNEMDGEWQIGHKTAHEYGRLAADAASMMKMTDPEIELVLCGSSSRSMPTFPEWDAEVLRQAYNYVDYISLHSYYENDDGDLGSFLASGTDMENFITGMIAVCDHIKLEKRSGKTMMLSFDEWNIWYHLSRIRPYKKWSVGEPLFEDSYGVADAVAFGGMLNALLRHCDRVKIACLAQLVNVIAPIMTVPGGGIYRQTTYYPFLNASLYGRGTVLDLKTGGDVYESKRYGTVPYVDSAAVLSESGEVSIFLCNRHLTEEAEVSFALQEFGGYLPVGHTVLTGEPDARNTAESPESVVPAEGAPVIRDGDKWKTVLPALSWNMIRFAKPAGK